MGHILTSKESLALNLIFGSMGELPFNRTMDDYLAVAARAPTSLRRFMPLSTGLLVRWRPPVMRHTRSVTSRLAIENLVRALSDFPLDRDRPTGVEQVGHAPPEASAQSAEAEEALKSIDFMGLFSHCFA